MPAKPKDESTRITGTSPVSTPDTPPAQAGSTTTPPPAATAPSAASSGASWQWLFWAAVLVVLIYVGFALLAFIRADDNLPENDWSRSVYILLGVEAIAFTAVGWLFGREVHRGEAQAAKKDAEDAKEDAAEAKGDAREHRAKADAAKDKEADARERAVSAEVRGRALADAVRAAGPAGPAGPPEPPTGVERRSGERGLPPAGAAHDPLRDLADRLFPPE